MSPKSSLWIRLCPLLLALPVAACDIVTDTDDVADPSSVEEGEVYAEVPVDGPPADGNCPSGLPEGITEEDIEDWFVAMERLVGAAEASERLCALLVKGIPEAIQHSSDSVPPPDPDAAWAWIKLRTHAKLSVDPVDVLELGCGETPLGTVLCGALSPTPSDTEMIAVTQVLSAPVPLTSSEYFGQYGFVFDSNGIAADNYVASPAYPNDFYQGTDRWYSLETAPGQPPALTAYDLTGGAITATPTAARLLVKDATIILLVPASEMAVPCPGVRVTAFTHRGDYGFNPPNFWAGDTEPTVADPLESACGASS